MAPPHDYYMIMTALLYGCYFAITFLMMLIRDCYSILIFDKAKHMFVLGILSVPFTAMYLFIRFSDFLQYFKEAE